MSEPIDLETTIADAVNDATYDHSPEPVEVDSTPAVEVTADEPAVADTPAESTDSAVPSPASQTATPAEPQDEFEKLVGVPQVGVAGRENRIPYSRVKKITEKAVSDLAEGVLGRKLIAGERPADVVKSYAAQIPQLAAKVQDYESRLENVGQFENVMANEPQKFLTMLARIPAYKDFFEFVERAAKGGAVAQPAAEAVQPAANAAPVDPASEMPKPDEELTDGSRVYSEEGLKKLLEWNAAQAVSRVTKQFEDRYKPIEQDWKERQRIEATLPIIQQQIADAKTWPLFNENEEEITNVLAADQRISLEGAYRKVVFPKLVAERNATRQSVLQEIKSAPTSTSVPTRVASRPNAPAAGPRSLEDIIKESLSSLGGR